ncbi:hypothetical protein K388_06947 [Streptomyces sp. KhCrAH-43]|uniref:hypothetical protein n=1 Tax=unclassified Streptomyces TaxID=2593676 RepID=UPI000370C196|nr:MULTISPECIES: hypothetical protein [unclassified Streptomyces]MYS32938.1 hypothetical protein [Streptomyces sp. SID4920]MYX64271.1 hypothetical protein [Streptomyces sp. SID8373]RAJ48681.1 hypothetical protein K388_06947 [Streptomyces sp. KhCrAH-43]
MTPYTVNHARMNDALDDAHTRIQRAEDRLARVACTHIAATVRDILTDHEPSAPFDATHLRLTGRLGREPLTTDGTYWTAAGEQRGIPAGEPFDVLSGWVSQLNWGSRHIWRPLCETPDAPGANGVSYRLDLAQAAQIPDEVHTSARVREIRDRLAAATYRPWSAEEFTWNRNGATVDKGDPDAVRTDFVVSDSTEAKVAEVSVSYDGPEDTDTPAEDVAETRANAELITRAPEDLLYLLAYLDHLAGATDAEELHPHGYCGRCGTALYISTASETPTTVDGSDQCRSDRLPTGSTFSIPHVLRT